MKHSAIVFALLGASVGSAFAQSSVGVYGVLDAGLVSERGCSGCMARIDSGIASESRIGIRGNEMLTDSLSAIFALEAGVLLDSGRSDQGGLLFGRQAYVGLKGKAGTVTVGPPEQPRIRRADRCRRPVQGRHGRQRHLT